MAVHSADHGRGRHGTDQQSDSRPWSRMEKGPVMSTITIPRPDVTTEEVSEVLRRGLGTRYNVLPGKGMNWNPAGKADQQALDRRESPPGSAGCAQPPLREYQARVPVAGMHLPAGDFPAGH